MATSALNGKAEIFPTFPDIRASFPFTFLHFEPLDSERLNLHGKAYPYGFRAVLWCLEHNLSFGFNSRRAHHSPPQTLQLNAEVPNSH
jgi:hypothetical protein